MCEHREPIILDYTGNPYMYNGPIQLMCTEFEVNLLLRNHAPHAVICINTGRLCCSNTFQAMDKTTTGLLYLYCITMKNL